MTLYEIDQALEEAWQEAIDPETGEILNEEALEILDELAMAKEEKIENILLLYKQYLAEAKAIKEEKMALAKRQATAERKAESIKNYAQRSLAGEAFKTPRVAVSYRKTQSVNITDPWHLPDKFIILQEPKANKKLIKEALKLGVNIQGAEIIENTSMTIK